MASDRAQAALRLNGFVVEFNAAEFEVRTQPRTPDFDLKAERLANEADWRLFADREEILAVRARPDAPDPLGDEARREVHESFSLVKWLVDEALPTAFPKYQAMRRHPFTFVGTKRDLVAETAGELNLAGDLLDGFAIRPRYALESRVVSFRGSSPFIGLFVVVSTRWEIERDITQLVESGVDVGGMYVVRRVVEPDQRRLVGRIDRVEGGKAFLSDTFEGPTELPARDLKLEGSRHSFARCVRKLLGRSYDRFESARAKRADAWMAPQAIDAEVDRIGEFLADKSLWLADGLEARLGKRIEISKRGQRANAISLSRVRYCFDAARTKQNDNAWAGLSRFGPFSADTFPKKSPRILVIFPDTLKGRVETFLRALRDGVTGAKASGYGAGLATTFALIDPQFSTLPVPWTGGAAPHDRYRTAIEARLATPGEAFDAAIVVLRDEDAQLPDPVNPYLHSKALLLVAGIPTQEVREATIGDARGLPYTLRNIATALYAKLGGTPWTVNQDLTISDEVVIGVGQSELAETRFAQRQRYVGVTTVFRGDGNYLLGNLSRECSFDEYPDVLRQSTTQVLEDIKRRNAWQPGDTVRVVCHAHRPLRDVATAAIMADCVAAVGDEQTIEFAFLTVSHDHPFRLIDPTQPDVYGKGRMVPERGTVVSVSRDSRILAVTGPSLVRTSPAPLPDPLLVRLHRASTFKDLDYLTEQVLKFTALSWRSVLPGKQPVTIVYSELIANLLGRLRAVPDWSPATLNTALRPSRWFL